MGFRINTNIAAMNAHNNATINNRAIDKSLGRLSSGLRINTAADDASGMVIANSLRSQASSLGQAIRNGNDAIGLIQTADGALDEYSKILDTIKTKSIQAASDGQNTGSRLAIQKDIDRLMEELDIIATTTSFNGQKLLSGTFVNKEFQMGANANESVQASIASTETSQIGQTTRARLDISDIGVNQITVKSAITGETIELESFEFLANNDPQNGMGEVAKQINRHSGDTGITAIAIVEVTTGKITEGVTGADFSINGVTIGAIKVSENDSDGTLMNAINAKTNETGVAATKTIDGKLELRSVDGRVIEVTGDVAVTGATEKELSTIGYLEVVQAGASTFEIEGASLAAAVGGDIVTTGPTTTLENSTLAAGSVIGISSTLAAGTTFGVAMSSSANIALLSSTADGMLTVGSVLQSGSKLNDGTELASEIGVLADTELSSDMFVKAGSVLATGTILDAGTVLNQDFQISGVQYKAGTVLAVDTTITTSTTLSEDMIMIVDLSNTTSVATIGSGSRLQAGTVLGGDTTISSDSTLVRDMILKTGSVLLSDSLLQAGSYLGDDMVTDSAYTTTVESTLNATSILTSASTLKTGSTIGGNVTLRVDVVVTEDMAIKAGSTVATGTIFKAGTVLEQDLTAAQVGGGVGTGLKAGTVLGTDVVTTSTIYVVEDFTIAKGSTLESGSTLAINAGEQNSVTLSEEEFTNLADISVITLEGAMHAIDTLTAAIGNLDTIRSDLGSVQNQIVSTINNISVTQVNVKAAESQIRDVDFAAESATFSKHNILAQSGSYAMSQANAVQQNVLSLLQ